MDNEFRRGGRGGEVFFPYQPSPSPSPPPPPDIGLSLSLSLSRVMYSRQYELPPRKVTVLSTLLHKNLFCLREPYIDFSKLVGLDLGKREAPGRRVRRIEPRRRCVVAWRKRVCCGARERPTELYGRPGRWQPDSRLAWVQPVALVVVVVRWSIGTRRRNSASCRR